MTSALGPTDATNAKNETRSALGPPSEAQIEAAARAVFDADDELETGCVWEEASESAQDWCRDIANAVLRAAGSDVPAWRTFTKTDGSHIEREDSTGSERPHEHRWSYKSCGVIPRPTFVCDGAGQPALGCGEQKFLAGAMPNEEDINAVVEARIASRIAGNDVQPALACVDALRECRNEAKDGTRNSLAKYEAAGACLRIIQCADSALAAFDAASTEGPTDG